MHGPRNNIFHNCFSVFGTSITILNFISLWYWKSILQYLEIAFPFYLEGCGVMFLGCSKISFLLVESLLCRDYKDLSVCSKLKHLSVVLICRKQFLLPNLWERLPLLCRSLLNQGKFYLCFLEATPFLSIHILTWWKC